MDQTHIDPGEQIIKDRLLLTEPAPDFLRQLLLVTCGSVSDPYIVRVAVTAPGMPSKELFQIREDLVKRLRSALKPTNMGDKEADWRVMSEQELANQNPWIHLIRLERNPNTGMNEVVFSITDHQHMGAKSTPAIMSHIRALLAEVACAGGRSLVILAADQRLVPLNFDIDSDRRASMSLELPPGLRLKLPRRLGDEYAEDEGDRSRLSLKRTLETLLGLGDMTCFVDVRSGRSSAARINISFGVQRTQPSAGQVNWAQRVVAYVLSQHCFYQGSFDRLVIVPARAEYDIMDEGDCDDSFDRYVEY
jgi:hypothetical protein